MLPELCGRRPGRGLPRHTECSSCSCPGRHATFPRREEQVTRRALRPRSPPPVGSPRLDNRGEEATEFHSGHLTDVDAGGPILAPHRQALRGRPGRPGRRQALGRRVPTHRGVKSGRAGLTVLAKRASSRAGARLHDPKDAQQHGGGVARGVAPRVICRQHAAAASQNRLVTGFLLPSKGGDAHAEAKAALRRCLRPCPAAPVGGACSPDAYCTQGHSQHAKGQRPAASVRVSNVPKQQGPQRARGHGETKDQPAHAGPRRRRRRVGGDARGVRAGRADRSLTSTQCRWHCCRRRPWSGWRPAGCTNKSLHDTCGGGDQGETSRLALQFGCATLSPTKPF